MSEEDSIEDTYEGVEGMSGKVYNHLVKCCTGEAFGVVRAVETGDGVEAWVRLHQKYSQEDDGKDDAGGSRMHVPEGGEGGGARSGDNDMGGEVESNDGRSARW